MQEESLAPAGTDSTLSLWERVGVRGGRATESVGRSDAGWVEPRETH